MSEPEERCRRCRAPLPPDARFCPQCGARDPTYANEVPLHRVLMALGTAISAILLGVFGACSVWMGFGMTFGGGMPTPMALLLVLLGAAAMVGVVRLVRP